MPIYRIDTEGEEKPRLVKADSAAQAIRHCATGMFSAKLCSNVEDAAGLFADGVKLETAGQQPEAEAEKEEEQTLTPPNKQRANAKAQEQ